ncbi:MAG: A/G-specific adenine glycosylase, partial [Geminicoccaceae bacterium]
MSLPSPPSKTDAMFDDLLAWYDAAKRDLPWRAAPGAPVDAYAVLVSEVMLQQTTVATVRGRFAGFMARFPTVEDLARAPLDDVLHAWQGLGYYRRARGLHGCALALVTEHAGRWPRTVEGLQNLPGVGPYTAAAIAAIAFDQPVLAVDGNVERVLARLFRVTTPLPGARAELRRLAHGLRPQQRPGCTVQAMIELGALVCRPRAPGCLTCPLRRHCQAAAAGEALSLPRKAPKKARPQHFAVVFHLRRADGAVLFRRRPAQGLLASMIELPSTPWRATPPSPEAALALAPAHLAWQRQPGRVRHVFTHLSLELELWCGVFDGA